MKRIIAISVAIIASGFLYPGSFMAAEKVVFEPVRAPSMGPENAPVTIIEIVDYM